MFFIKEFWILINICFRVSGETLPQIIWTRVYGQMGWAMRNRAASSKVSQKIFLKKFYKERPKKLQDNICIYTLKYKKPGLPSKNQINKISILQLSLKFGS